jgi:hypothetical protein
MHEQGDKAAQAADIIESSSRKVEAAEAKVEGKQFASSFVLVRKIYSPLLFIFYPSKGLTLSFQQC